MMHSTRRVFAAFAALALLAAVPRHVQTADYWQGAAGTKNVPAQQAARALSWVETDVPGSQQISPLGVKTLLYTNPNRVMPGDPLYGPDEDEYAHTCGGARARGEARYRGLVLTNPRSRTLASMWRRSVDAHTHEAHFDAVFADEAVGTSYAQDNPCNYDFDDWIRAETQLFRGLGYPVIYNGLNHFDNHGIAKEIALNKSAAGGMMEECYAQLDADHRVGGWQWWATEETELDMARDSKYFFCYGRDLTPADQAHDGRMYTYASFLLTYDPRTTVLWEYYKTPSGGHVMPESQLVALDPVKRVTRVAQLRAPGGAYVREYRKCYLGGRFVGACAAAVNPDTAAHDLRLPGYNRTLTLQGSGIFDGGTVRITAARPPEDLQPLGAAIVFK
ncbi:MAG TPA: hypothetical protein VFN37_02980 [Candidatus Baltobacteraceae bacterium]|nr:hypothetical protein [Candidatus Baltobacteraceae bacterium]